MDFTSSFYIAAILGFIALHLASHPKSRIRKKLPELKVLGLQLCPNIKIHAKGRTIHLHHWINFGILLLIAIPAGGFFDSHITKGFLTGGLIQGLTYNDAIKIYSSKTKTG